VHSTTKITSPRNGTVTGGCRVDSGKFDWSANDKFHLAERAAACYHGLKFHETFGQSGLTFFRIAIRPLRDLGMTMNPQAGPLYADGDRDPEPAQWTAIVRQRPKDRQMAGGAIRGID